MRTPFLQRHMHGMWYSVYNGHSFAAKEPRHFSHSPITLHNFCKHIVHGGAKAVAPSPVSDKITIHHESRITHHVYDTTETNPTTPALA
jgi:hypothetical protein